MGLERIIGSLTEIGITRLQAEVYVYLAKKGPKTIGCLSKTLFYNRKEIEKGLKVLQSKGLITRNQLMFCALPFEQVLTLLIETKKEQAQDVVKKKEELIVTWENND